MGVDKAFFQEKLAGRGGAPHYKRIQKAITSFRKYAPEIERFLDVGCDDGRITAAIKEATKAKEAYGIDIFTESCQAAQARGIKCTQLYLDKDNFPFPDNYFDAIFCGEVIEHVFDTDHVLDEIYRTLSLRGICVISTPNLASLPNRIALLFGLQPYGTSVSINYRVGRLWHKGLPAEDHIRVFTYRAFKELIKIHKFKIIETQGLTASDGSDPPFPLPIKLAERIIAIIPSFAHTVQLVIRK